MAETIEWRRLLEETYTDLHGVVQTAGYTDRMEVPGGWIYRVIRLSGGTAALCFVPEPSEIPFVQIKGEPYDEGLMLRDAWMKNVVAEIADSIRATKDHGT